MAATKTLFPNVAAVLNLNSTEKTTAVSSFKTNVAVSSPGKLCHREQSEDWTPSLLPFEIFSYLSLQTSAITAKEFLQ